MEEGGMALLLFQRAKKVEGGPNLQVELRKGGSVF
jgi:hypothetical protein